LEKNNEKRSTYIPEGSKLFNEYVNAVEWAQKFAALNREMMMSAAIHAVNRTLGQILSSNKIIQLYDTAINCHHNYISKENHFGKNV